MCKYGTVVKYCKTGRGQGDLTREIPYNCYSKVKGCSKVGKKCAEGTRPEFDVTTCCPSCDMEKPQVKLTCPTPRLCGNDENPSYDSTSGCMSCKVSLDKCSSGQLASCKENTAIADCLPGETPVRSSNCCLSCKIPQNACGKKGDSSGLSMPSSCGISVNDLAQCAADTRPSFDVTTCCPSCKPQIPAKAKKGTEECSKSAIEACKSSVSMCQQGEQSEPIKGSCCKSCFRAKAACTVLDFSTKCEKVPDCVDDEVPSFEGDSCCPSCKKKRPACDPECASGTVCARKKSSSVAVCVEENTKRLELTFPSKPASVTPEMVTEMIAATVEKFCDNPDNEAQCKEEKDDAVDGLVTHVVTPYDPATGTVTVQVRWPRKGSVPARRLFQTTDIVSSAVSDPDFADSFSARDTLLFSAASQTTLTMAIVMLPAVVAVSAV